MQVPLLVNDFLRRAARVYPDKLAIVDAANRYSYRQFQERANRLSNVSGATIRAVLVAAGNFNSAFVQNQSRMNNEQGSGHVEVGIILPLGSFPGGPVAGDPRRALRPNDGGTPPTIPTVPTGLRLWAASTPCMRPPCIRI